MKRYILPEVEGVRGDGLLSKALRAIRDAVNDLSSRREAGTGVLVAGVVRVTVPGLQASTVVVPGYETLAGTTGTLSCSRAEYDVQTKTATIRSSSATDTSTVSWVALT